MVHRETPLVPKVGHALHLSPPCMLRELARILLLRHISAITTPGSRSRARLRVEIARSPAGVLALGMSGFRPEKNTESRSLLVLSHVIKSDTFTFKQKYLFCKR